MSDIRNASCAKPRVLFINHAFGLSGSTISLGYMVKGFAASGYEVFVVQKNNDKGAAYLQERSAIVFCMHVSIGLSLSLAVEEDLLKPFEFLNFLKNFAKIPLGMLFTWYYVRKVKPSLLYLNEFVLPHCSLVGKLMGVPTVMHVRGPIIRGRWGIRRWLLKRMVRSWNNCIIAITETDARQFRNTNGAEDPRRLSSYNICIVNEFLDGAIARTSLHHSLKKQFGLKESARIVTMLGGVSRIKGTSEFVQAAQQLDGVLENVVFVVAGAYHSDSSLSLTKEQSKRDKKYSKSVFQFLHEHNLWKRVKFLGEVRNIKDILYCTDVLVSPSTISHFSRPVIEAWSLKKPAIMTDTPHAREFIEDGVDGLLVPMSNPQRLADAIHRVLTDRELAHRLGENGYQKAKRLFNAEANVGKIVETCDGVIKK
jgi:glycosyltransferase involved in cell wall biosynthesis